MLHTSLPPIDVGVCVSIKTSGKTESHGAKLACTEAARVSIKFNRRRLLKNTLKYHINALPTTDHETSFYRESAGEGTSGVRSIYFLKIDITPQPRGLVVAKPRRYVQGKMPCSRRGGISEIIPFWHRQPLGLWSDQAVIIDRTPAVRSPALSRYPPAVYKCVSYHATVGRIRIPHTPGILSTRDYSTTTKRMYKSNGTSSESPRRDASRPAIFRTVTYCFCCRAMQL